MPDIQITYDTLIDISRRERSKPELQKLESTFYQDILEYLKDKHTILEDLRNREDQFANDASRQNTEDQITNARKLIRDIYERRERKIIEMALGKSRTGSEVIDTSALLEEETRFFELCVKLFNKYRSSVLHSLLSLKPIKHEAPPTPEPSKQTSAVEPKKGDIVLRFLHGVPKFVGTDMAVYGPYEAEDVAKLAPEIAKVLIEKGRAEEIVQG